MTHKNKQSIRWMNHLVSFVSFSLIIGVIWTAFWWSGFRESLTITQVRFGKTNILNTHIYEAALGDIIGSNPNDIELKAMSDLIESHPYVKAARVSHQYPGMIQIEIIERQPIALLKTEPMVMLDAEGVVLPNVENLGDFNLPILTNFNPEPDLYPPGQITRSVKVKECIVWLSQIEKEYESLYNNLSEMKISSSNEMELILADHPTQIYLGQDQLWHRIEILKQFEKELGQKKISDFAYLDIRYENQIIAKGRLS